VKQTNPHPQTLSAQTRQAHITVQNNLGTRFLLPLLAWAGVFLLHNQKFHWNILTKKKKKKKEKNLAFSDSSFFF
jgi:hypothetical protein